jgi:transposase-like protein
VQDFLSRPIEGDWPYLWLDATYVKVREAGRIVSVAVTIAVGVNSDGRREVLGMAVGASEAETFWTDFLRGLARRGLRGVKLVISDAHEGLKPAVAKVLRATWQRCRVHFGRNAAAHAGKAQRRIVSAWIGTAYAEADAEGAKRQWRTIADQLRPKVPKLANLMDAAEEDVLAFMDFPREHRAKLHSTDEIDKLFRRDLLFWPGTGDRVAKSRARGCEPGRAAFTVAPHWRHPCAAFPGRVVASARRIARRPARPAARP